MPQAGGINDIDYRKQTHRNILSLMNNEPFNVVKCLEYFNQPYLSKFFEIYQEFGCEGSGFLHCVLTTISALADGISLTNVASHTDSALNLMTHIIGEPGNELIQKQNISQM